MSLKVCKVHKVCKVGSRGFTLVELVVVIGVTGIIMAVVTGILLDSFKTKNRINVADLVEQNAAFIGGELRKNVVNGVVQSCTANSIDIVNKSDFGETTITCANSKIASSSANPVFAVDLSGSNVVALNCASFVQCEETGGKVNKVIFTYTLSGGSQVAGVANFVEKTFVTEVAARD
jgi:prepilin-type N-terminal cleavage/methylation domain-containing protein